MVERDDDAHVKRKVQRVAKLEGKRKVIILSISANAQRSNCFSAVTSW